MEDHKFYWKLKRFSSWLKMQSVFQEPNLENNMAQQRMTRRIRQLEEEKLFAENASIERTRQQTQDSRTERSHLNFGIGGGEHRAEGTSQGVEGTNSISDDVFARAWGGEFGRELCGMAETRGENTMSTLST